MVKVGVLEERAARARPCVAQRRQRQRAVQRPHELHASLLRDKGQGQRSARLDARGQEQLAPAAPHLGIGRLGKGEARIDERQRVRAGREVYEAVQERFDFVVCPIRSVLAPRPQRVVRRVWGRPCVGEARNALFERLVEADVRRRHAHDVEPGVPVETPRRGQLLQRKGAKVCRRQSLTGEALEVRLDKGTKRLSAGEALQCVQQRRALLVRHERKDVVRVDPALEGRDEGRVARLAAGNVVVDGAAQRRKRAGQVKVNELLEALFVVPGVDGCLDVALEPARPALVEPKVRPGGVCDEVAGPRVRDLVRHDAGERLVAGEERRRHERQARVLHAAVGERRRQADEVVAAPGVGQTRDGLGRAQKVLRLRKLQRRRVYHRPLRPDAASARNVARVEVGADDCDEVRRRADVLAPVRLGHGPGLASVAEAGHKRRGPLGRGDGGGPGELGAGRVLARQQRPRVDGLALGEHVRKFLVRRLLRREPLRRRAPPRIRRVLEAHPERAPRGGACAERHRRRRPQDGVRRAEGPFRLCTVDGDP
mmetsp:Transcript_13848/g.46180  ORF Transcript_13848/g.46180 Transcript_13848/m.46180 type:complete len:540 (+) Transcript_13848:2290-3909(+)